MCQEGTVTSERPGEMVRTLPAVTARERDLRDGAQPEEEIREVQSLLLGGQVVLETGRVKLGQRAGLTYRVSFPWG